MEHVLKITESVFSIKILVSRACFQHLNKVKLLYCGEIILTEIGKYLKDCYIEVYSLE